MTQRSNWPWPIWPVGLDKIRFMANTSFFSIIYIIKHQYFLFNKRQQFLNPFLTHGIFNIV